MRKMKPKVKRKKSNTKSTYVRGSLIKKMYEFYDKVTLEKATYEKCLALAIKVKPDTKFNHYHHSWYRNDYRNKRNLPSPTSPQTQSNK